MVEILKCYRDLSKTYFLSFTGSATPESKANKPLRYNEEIWRSDGYGLVNSNRVFDRILFFEI